MDKESNTKEKSHSQGKYSEDEIDLRELFQIFVKRKWWFVGTFIVVLIAGLLFTFLQTPEYSSTSNLKISDSYYIETLMKYFPELASKLNIGTVNDVAVELKSTALTDKVIKSMGSEISKNDLDKAINVSVDEKNQIITVTTKHSNPLLSYKINKFLVETYVGKKTSELTEVYQEFLKRVEEAIANTSEEIKKLSTQTEKNLIDTNLKIIEELENRETGNVYFSGINYVSPVLLGELNSKWSACNELEKIKFILSENEKFFTSKIEVIKYPEIPGGPAETNYRRNILISLFLAIILGCGVVFVANYFASLKKQ